MAYSDNDLKFAAVINRRHGLPVILNAVGHLTAGLARQLGVAPDYLAYYNPAEGITALISRYPYIVLEAKNSSQLATLRRSAGERGVAHNTFVSAMLGGHSAEHQRALVEAARDVDYVAIVLFGEKAEVDPLIRRFSLLRDRPTGDPAPGSAQAAS